MKRKSLYNDKAPFPSCKTFSLAEGNFRVARLKEDFTLLPFVVSAFFFTF
jgi:hypothetical protein